jgi:hypothetical protein
MHIGVPLETGTNRGRGAVKQIDSDESVHRDVDTAKIVVDRLSILPTGIRPPSTCGYPALLVRMLSPALSHYCKFGGREPPDAIHEDRYEAVRNTGHFHRHLKTSGSGTTTKE